MTRLNNTAIESKIETADAVTADIMAGSRTRRKHLEDITDWMQVEQEVMEVDFLRCGVKSHHSSFDDSNYYDR